MNLIANAFVTLVALLHIYFFVLEMFLWTKPLGMKIFRMSQDKANETKTLAANQGLYNSFLAAGLIWGLIHPFPELAVQIKFFFLSCVVIAGIYGAYSVNRRIFFIQSTPAILALVLTWLA